MLGPSGFFMADIPEDSPVSSTDLEFAHSSQSGFNVLYRGCKNGRFFIYKGLKPEYVGNPVYEGLLKKDFDIGFSLSHNNICQYYAMISHPEIGNCIVMEWIDGCTLEDMIRRNAIDKDLARKIICELCDALDYMHGKQVIHRDLKPENIMITQNGKNVKIIDFGLSDTDSYNRFKGPAGTRIYASPEQEAGEPADNRSDIWALGMIMNEMSGKFRHVAGKCLRRDKERRYSTASEVKNAVMRGNSRTVAIWVSVFLIGIVIAAVIATLPDHQIEAVQQDPTAPVVEPETVQKADTVEIATRQIKEVKPEPAAPSKEPEEQIDESSLDEMFNEAASLLL